MVKEEMLLFRKDALYGVICLQSLHYLLYFSLRIKNIKIKKRYNKGKTPKFCMFCKQLFCIIT